LLKGLDLKIFQTSIGNLNASKNLVH